MSGARQHDHHLLSGDFVSHDELAAMFEHQRADAAPATQQPWFMDYLHAVASPLDCDAFVAGFDDVPPTVDEIVKREELLVDTAATGGGGATTTAPLTPNSMSMSSTSSEACGAGGAGAGEELATAGKSKKEEGDGEGFESKDGDAAAAKGDARGQEKSKKG